MTVVADCRAELLTQCVFNFVFFFSSRRRHTRCLSDWSSDVCSSDLGSFTQLADKNQQNLRQILEAAASAKAAPGSNEQKIGDFYASCMDTATIDAAGTKPIEPDLARIASIKTVADLQAVTEYLHSQGIGPLFRF